MTFGMNSFLFVSPFTNDSLHLIKKIKAWGFDSIELPIEDVSHVDAKVIKKALDDNGIICGSVCGAMGPDRDLRGTKQQQQTAIDYLKGLMDIMAEINSPVLVGPLYSAVGRADAKTDDEFKKQWHLVVNNMKEVAVHAKQRKVKLAVEPLNRYETDFINTCAQVMQLVKDVGGDEMGVLLDTYHMNIEEKNSADAIRLAGDRLYHFHACGCDRGTPGNDHINWKSIVEALREIKYDRSAVIESFTTDVKVIAKAASIWRQFEPSQEDIAVKGLKFLKEAFGRR
ncbi:MAG: sugar phosphate isomerase/epimerase [Chitinophagaceae bacterium]|nr:sugar phosphate isomerase/epimerase [Chitinophagaceae bacterium]